MAILGLVFAGFVLLKLLNGRLNELETLAVGGELISDDVCNDLANMKSLRVLELHNTAITEAGLEVLTKAFGIQPNSANRTVICLQKE